MNAFEKLKEIIEDARTRGGCHDTAVDALFEIVAESDRLGDGWYSTADEKLKDFVGKDILVGVNGKVRLARYAIDDTLCTDDDGNEYSYSHWFTDEMDGFAWEFDEIKYWQPVPTVPKAGGDGSTANTVATDQKSVALAVTVHAYARTEAIEIAVNDNKHLFADANPYIQTELLNWNEWLVVMGSDLDSVMLAYDRYFEN